MRPGGTGLVLLLLCQQPHPLEARCQEQAVRSMLQAQPQCLLTRLPGLGKPALGSKPFTAQVLHPDFVCQLDRGSGEAQRQRTEIPIARLSDLLLGRQQHPGGLRM